MKFRSLILLASSAFALCGCQGLKDALSSAIEAQGFDPKNFVLGLGGENVPVGDYSKKILQYYELDQTALEQKGAISYGADVKAVTTAVKQGTVTAGIIYKTDAFSAELTNVDAATAAMCGQVIYPAASIKNTNGHTYLAKHFTEYLTTAAAMEEFEKVGFVSACEPREVEALGSGPYTLKVFAAASLTESLNAVKAKYEAAYPQMTLDINYGSSGALQTQIETDSRVCDLFISAGAKQMNALENHEGGSLLVEDTRFNFLENQVVLAVPDNNPADLHSFDDLAVMLRKVLAA